MMRSLYSGVAGLKTHQTRMDVIGHNIANVNTTAFKSSTMVFSELMSQTTQRASGANAATGTGGVNARQIGLGVKGGAININIAGQGSSQSTGNPFDVMITGDNFFVVSDGMQNYFTRDGSFYVDGAGNLAMTSNGYNVMGWGVDEESGKIRQDTVAALRIMDSANMTYPPEATSQAYISGILDENDKDAVSANGKVVNLNFFDARGYQYTARITFKQSANPDEYSMELTKLLDSTGKEVEIPEDSTIKSLNEILGGDTAQKQEKNTKVSFDDQSYKWSSATELQAKDKDGNWVAHADLTKLVNGGNWILDDPNSYTAEQVADAQKALDNLVEVYGYEGSPDEFLNLLVETADTATPPNVAENSIKQLLLSATGATVTPAPHQTLNALGKEFTSTGRNFTGAKILFDGDKGPIAQVNGSATNLKVNLNMSALGGNFSNIELDLSQMTSYDNKGTSTVGATSGATGLGDVEKGVGSGRRLGKMIGVSIQNNGMIYASYDNGMTKLLGQIATAAFANASGLEKNGDNLYNATLNSGEFDGIGVDITANGGYMSTGQLEMSNVDLSAEFTEMITTQRGFQANSRIITVSDTLLEELTNLKR